MFKPLSAIDDSTLQMRLLIDGTIVYDAERLVAIVRGNGRQRGGTHRFFLYRCPDSLSGPRDFIGTVSGWTAEELLQNAERRMKREEKSARQ